MGFGLHPGGAPATKRGSPPCLKLTSLHLPRAFLDQIGFNAAIRKAIRVPTDPQLVQIFQKLAPNFDWARAQACPGVYQPPRWMGYWKTLHALWASDGVVKLQLQDGHRVQALFTEAQACHFRHQVTPPYESTSLADPSHLLLHDTELGRVYVTAFEHGEATLVRQSRPPF